MRDVLLGRSLAGWGATDAVCDELGIVAEPPLELGPLAAGEAARRALFEAACHKFAQVYGVRAPDGRWMPGGAGDGAYASVLTLHMAALAVVDAHARGDRPPARAGELSRWLLHRERHWPMWGSRGRSAGGFSRRGYGSIRRWPCMHAGSISWPRW
ncbi:hypothetical protein ACIA5D_22435 [Actinoplanes sp. NPDC051513]|uniref:hypothetical protein n=1 Tax=Actinoplanes sp. NPDC051513 TaxID=3363908 RepID=UPI0037BD32E4